MEGCRGGHLRRPSAPQTDWSAHDLYCEWVCAMTKSRTRLAASRAAISTIFGVSSLFVERMRPEAGWLALQSHTTATAAGLLAR